MTSRYQTIFTQSHCLVTLESKTAKTQTLNYPHSQIVVLVYFWVTILSVKTPLPGSKLPMWLVRRWYGLFSGNAYELKPIVTKPRRHSAFEEKNHLNGDNVKWSRVGLSDCPYLHEGRRFWLQPGVQSVGSSRCLSYAENRWHHRKDLPLIEI